MSFLKKLFSKQDKATLDQGLEKSKSHVFSKLAKVFTGRRVVDEDLMDELEEALITADVGVETTMRLLSRLRKRARFEAYMEMEELYGIMREEMAALFHEDNRAPEGYAVPQHETGPHVILVVGVNGVGKTTSIGKLAHRYKSQGLDVILGAADTFRAAAIDQLKVWAERVGVPVVAQNMGADPASVAFDTLQSAVARKADVAIVDTAGRLHNKKGLMEELGKVRRVMDKVVPGAPHEVWLVLDGSTGQNAVEQARQFIATTDVTGLIVTKLDGTAKGGVVLAISLQFSIPVRYIGVGEKLDNLQDFHLDAFLDSLLPERLKDGLDAAQSNP